MTVVRYEIHDFADVVEPGATVRAGRPAEVSIGTVRPGLAQRVIDFFSGVAVTGSATMTRLSPGLFLITPSGPPPYTEPLISLPRVRPGRGVEAPAVAELNPAGRWDRPFWPEHRRG